MPRILSKPLIQRFEFKDEMAGDFAIDVVQLRQGDFEFLEQYRPSIKYTYDDNGIIDGAQQPVARLKWERALAYRALVAVHDFNDEDGKPLFRSAEGADGARISLGMSESEFYTAWSRLLPGDVDKIVDACIQQNPTLRR